MDAVGAETGGDSLHEGLERRLGRLLASAGRFGLGGAGGGDGRLGLLAFGSRRHVADGAVATAAAGRLGRHGALQQQAVGADGALARQLDRQARARRGPGALLYARRRRRPLFGTKRYKSYYL